MKYREKRKVRKKGEKVVDPEFKAIALGGFKAGSTARKRPRRDKEGKVQLEETCSLWPGGSGLAGNELRTMGKG